MINTDRDVQISQLQNDIQQNTREIYRLQDETTTMIRKLRTLQAARDEESGLKVKVMDSEFQLNAIRNKEWI